MAKILVFEIKCCSKLHFRLAQPQLVLYLFFTLTDFEARVLIKRKEYTDFIYLNLGRGGGP